ncbi:2Fe-2S iron-sulfur cluster-binding protein [Streptomyces graminofaciens]|uniref:2Fe-2S iron-sulfur cluster-binding protein n=1 Tax=Streptomyces graminofaciens TaxID=68212 RepID=UPI003D9AD3E4
MLEAVRRAGAEVLASCEQGTCGRCLTPVLEGRPDHRDSRLADHQRAAKDCMFLCVSRSCGDRLTLDLVRTLRPLRGRPVAICSLSTAL